MREVPIAPMGSFVVLVQDRMQGTTKWINCDSQEMAERQKAEALKDLQDRFVVSIYKAQK